MHKHAFQGLKRTFLHVSGLPLPYFDNKTKNFIKFLVWLSKYGGGRPETCINVRFRPWNARLCMSQIFPHHILIIKLIYKVFGFIIKIWWGKTWDMHKRAFQGLKRTFMHVSGLPPPYFDNKTARLCMSQVFPHHIMKVKPIYGFNYQNMVGEDLRHA